MVPVTIETPKLVAIHIDMGMPLALDIVKAGLGRVEGEICRHHMQVPAALGILEDFGVDGWRVRPVINHQHPVLMRHAVHHHVATSHAAVIHATAQGFGPQITGRPVKAGTDQRAAEKGDDKACQRRSRLGRARHISCFISRSHDSP